MPHNRSGRPERNRKTNRRGRVIDLEGSKIRGVELYMSGSRNDHAGRETRSWWHSDRNHALGQIDGDSIPLARDTQVRSMNGNADEPVFGLHIYGEGLTDGHRCNLGLDRSVLQT